MQKFRIVQSKYYISKPNEKLIVQTKFAIKCLQDHTNGNGIIFIVVNA